MPAGQFENQAAKGRALAKLLGDTTTNKPAATGGAAAVASPAVPASTVNATNSFGADCLVNVIGGTVTAITVAGSSTGMTSGAVVVPAGATISITYSVAPTWKWFALSAIPGAPAGYLELPIDETGTVAKIPYWL